MFTVYITTYLGDRMPPFYMGSTSFARLAKGYHGSVSSAKWSGIWKEEIKNNPHLFKTQAIPDATAETAKEIVAVERDWQKLFDVVNDPDFINEAYANRGFVSTPESQAKAQETKIRTGTLSRQPETRAKIGDANRGRKMPPVKPETKEKLSLAGKGRILTDEHKARIAASNTGKTLSDEAKAKISSAHTGKTLSENHKAKIVGTGRTHPDETKARMREAALTRTSGAMPVTAKDPRSDETREKIRQANLGKTWSPEKRAKIAEAKARSRAEKLA